MKKVIIIAEAGVNHNGDFELAKKLVVAAAQAGADYIKFQTFKADKIVSKSARKADYQIANINDGENSQYQMLKKLEMPEQWHYDLIEFSKKNGIEFLSTGFDEDSIDFLDQLGTPFYKIPSGEITNRPYLEHIASKKKPVIISTGMADMEEVRAAFELMVANRIPKNEITILHCNTEYPTPFNDVNLKAMNTIGETLGVAIGYSDHTVGIEVPIAAVALGAVVIEKHFTLDKTMPGPDHKASLEPGELTAMVAAIRNIEKAISGDGQKKTTPSEEKNKDLVRKSLHFKQSLQKGTVIQKEHLVSLRPGNGINPMDADIILGRVLSQNVTAFDQVSTHFFA